MIFSGDSSYRSCWEFRTCNDLTAVALRGERGEVECAKGLGGDWVSEINAIQTNLQNLSWEVRLDRQQKRKTRVGGLLGLMRESMLRHVKLQVASTAQKYTFLSFCTCLSSDPKLLYFLGSYPIDSCLLVIDLQLESTEGDLGHWGKEGKSWVNKVTRFRNEWHNVEFWQTKKLESHLLTC